MPNPENTIQIPPRREKTMVFEPAPEQPRKEQPAASPDSNVIYRPTKAKGESAGSGAAWDVAPPCQTNIKVIGVGGGGCNAVQHMIGKGFDASVEFYAINTDFQALQRCKVPNRIQIGQHLTAGSGAGSMPEVGERAAREAEEQIRQILDGADMVFITAGMGGGTGTGAAPVIAEIARSMDILNVAIVTKPFQFEGAQRLRRAIEGIRKLSESADTMITILNDKLMEAVGPKTPLTEAFNVANGVLAQGIRAISDLIALPGLINVDFRDVRTIMGETGGAVMGVGEGKGENRAVEAVRKAWSSPLQEKIVIDGAKGVLINITGPATITMHEINEAATQVYEAADPDANVIFGVVIDENMHDTMRVTIIATGFGGEGFEGYHTNGSGHDERERVRPRPGKLHAAPHVAPMMSFSPERETPHAPIAHHSPEAPPFAKSGPMPVAPKREDSPAPQPKVDFSAPDNPMKTWNPINNSANWEQAEDPFRKEENGHASTNGETITQAKLFADSQPATQADAAEGEDQYEIPALHRRRRHRFFE